MNRNILTFLLLLCSLCGMAGTLDKYEITPKSGSQITAEDLKQVKITFPRAKEIDGVDEVSVTVYDAKTEYDILGSIHAKKDEKMTIKDNYAILDLSEAANFSENNLKFKIFGYSFFDNESFDSSPEITWTYNLPEKPNPFDNMVVTPSMDETATQESIREVTITFPDLKSISFASIFNSGMEVWYNDKKQLSLYPGTNAEIDGNKVTFNVSSYWIETIPGKLELKFRDKYFKDEEGGVESKAFTLAWNIDKKHINYTATPAPGSTVSEEDLENFVITFPGANKVEVNTWYRMRLMYRHRQNESSGGWNPRDCDCTIEGNKVTVPIWQGDPNGGEFTLNIPEGLFIVDGADAPEINIDYTLKPIDIHYDLVWDTMADQDGKLHATIPEWGECYMTSMSLVNLLNEDGSEAGYVNIGNTGNDVFFTFYTYEGTEKVDIKPGKYHFTCPAEAVTIKKRLILYENRKVEIHFVKQTADGISSVLQDAECSKQNIFNLAGQRVSKDYRGIVIKNNRKVLMNK